MKNNCKFSKDALNGYVGKNASFPTFDKPQVDTYYPSAYSVEKDIVEKICVGYQKYSISL